MMPTLLLAVALAVVPAGRVDRDLVRLVCMAEHCRGDGVGKVVGPMQISRAWERTLCRGLRLREIWDSVECGVRLLVEGSARCGSAVAALGWFHTGACVDDEYARRIWRQWTRGRWS